MYLDLKILTFYQTLELQNAGEPCHVIVSVWETHHHPRTMSPTGREPWKMCRTYNFFTGLRFPIVTQHAAAFSITTEVPDNMTKNCLKSPVATELFLPLHAPICIYLVRSGSTCRNKYKYTAQEKCLLEEQPEEMNVMSWPAIWDL